MFKSGVQSVRAIVALPLRFSVAQVSSISVLPRWPSEGYVVKQAPAQLVCLTCSICYPVLCLLCCLLQTSVLWAGILFLGLCFPGTGVAPAVMRKMSGLYTGKGHATLLAAICGVLTSHGTTLPALGLTPGHNESPGEQVGLGQLYACPTADVLAALWAFESLKWVAALRRISQVR